MAEGARPNDHGGFGGPFGSNLTQKDYQDDGVPVVRGGNMGGIGRSVQGPFAYVSAEKFERDLTSNAARPGDIIVTQRGTIGQVAILPDDAPYPHYVVSQSRMAVRVDRTRADRDFVYYFLTSPVFNDYIGVTSIQTGVPHINLGLLRDVEVDWPLPAEQRAIASILGVLDDGIELNRKMNATLEAMARALFRDWFVDFGPTRAKMEGRTPYLSPNLWSLFPDLLDAEGKPDGWEMRRVDQLLELAYGKALKATDRQPGNVPVYGSGGITGSHSEALVAGPSVIVGRKGTVGSLYWEDQSFFPIDTVFYVRPFVPLTFCFYALEQMRLDHMNTDAAVPGLNRTNVYRLEVAWPGSPLVDAFDAIVSAMRAKITQNDDESRTLARTRDLLLPRLMSGELRVANLQEAERETA